jgi:cyanophycinase
VQPPCSGVAAQTPRIEPDGIGGVLIVCGRTIPPGAVEQFASLAKGPIVLLTTGKASKHLDTVRERLKKPDEEVPEFNEMPILAKPLPLTDVMRDQIKQAKGIWLVGDDPKAVLANEVVGAIAEVLKRGGIIGTSGQAMLAPSLIPDAAVVVADQRDRLKEMQQKNPALVGYEIADDAALTVRGRLLRTVGPGKVTIHLAAADQRPARQIVLEGKGLEDLTALRRAALARSLPAFPVADPPAPFVEKGTLIIVGGGGTPKGMNQRFVELAGGKEAKIVILPIANPGANNEKVGLAEIFRKLGAKKVTALSATQRDEVESKEFLDTLREATGVWFGGGRQWRFVDAYEGTKAAPLFHDVLKRGGVIGGSSAGASIQGDYMCRGNPLGNLEIAFEGYERGLGFLTGVAIDQHFTQRKRHPDMTNLMKLYPQLLGIGIDESTAIVVQGSVAEVVGNGKVHFYNTRRKTEPGAPDHEALGAGSRYDLKARMVK